MEQLPRGAVVGRPEVPEDDSRLVVHAGEEVECFVGAPDLGGRTMVAKSAMYELHDEFKNSSDVGVGMIRCPRCYRPIPEGEFVGHGTSHSAEILDWLYLGGRRNAENVVELSEVGGVVL